MRLTVILIIATAAPAFGRDLYRSDFSPSASQPAALSDWKLSGGRYRTDSGWLHVLSDKTNPQAILNVTHDGDGTYRATVRNAESCHRTMLLAKGIYQLEINNQYGRLELHRLLDKRWKLVGQVANYDRYSRDRHTFELRLTFVGRTVHAFIDDKKLISYEDANAVPVGGHYGLAGGWGTDVAWRDVRISDQPDLSEWPAEPAAQAAPKGLVEVTWVRATSSDGIFFENEPAGLNLKLTTRRAGTQKVRLVYRLVDFRQRVVAETPQELTLAANVQTPVTVQFDSAAIPGRGCFKVALFAGTGQNDVGWVEDVGSFTVLSRALAERARNEASYFGGHMDGINLEWHLQVGRKLGIRWARCHDMLQHTWWTSVQPDGPDRWSWQDKTQAGVDASGMATLGEFLWTPAWANKTKSGGKTASPADLSAFERYVAGTVGHYRKSIRHWEVWNEPHYSGFWTGTAEQYAQLLQSAYAAAKKADPSCFVLGGGGVDLGAQRWVEAAIKALPGKSMDGFSIHYPTPETIGERMAWLRELLRSQGLDVPIWNTEACVLSSSFLDQGRAGYMEPEARYHFRNACYELVRMYMENIANGVQRVFYYELADPWRFQEFAKPRLIPRQALSGGMWEEGRMLKPIAAAHAALAEAIDGRTFKTRIDNGPLHAFIFEGKDGATAVHYASFREFSTSAMLRFRLPEGLDPQTLSLCDFMGNRIEARIQDRELVCKLSREPVYMLYRGQDSGELLARLFRHASRPAAAPAFDRLFHAVGRLGCTDSTGVPAL